MFKKYNTLEEVKAVDTAILTSDRKLTVGVDPIDFFVVQTRIPGFINIIWSVTDVTEVGTAIKHYAFSLINEPVTMQNTKDVVIHTSELVRDIPELSGATITVDKRYIKTKFTDAVKIATVFIEKKFNREITALSLEAARKSKHTIPKVCSIAYPNQKNDDLLKYKIVVLPIAKIGVLQQASNSRFLMENDYQLFAEILSLNK